MPDTVVPIVRRPVRRVSTTPQTEPKVSELSSAARYIITVIKVKVESQEISSVIIIKLLSFVGS